MKKGKGNGKVLVFGASVCMASLVVLFGGMGVLAMRQGNDRELIEVRETETDVIGDVLNGGQEEEDLGWLDGVQILTWDEFYALGIHSESAADGVSGSTTGTGREPLENELSMEEAAILGLKEIRRVFGEDLEGQMLMMYLIDAPDGRHVWDGYSTNYMNGEAIGTENGAGEYKKPMENYSFRMNALTGEIIWLHHTHMPVETTGQELTEAEVLAKADACVEELGLIDLSEYHGTIAADDEYYWQSQESVNIVRYAREGGAPELGIYIGKDGGMLIQYEYYKGYGFEWEMF